MDVGLALGFVFLGMALGICVAVLIHELDRVGRGDPYIDAEMDAMEAADRLFEASDQARQDMREAVQQKRPTGRDPSRGQTP